jgi:hypothetical protein
VVLLYVALHMLDVYVSIRVAVELSSEFGQNPQFGATAPGVFPSFLRPRGQGFFGQDGRLLLLMCLDEKPLNDTVFQTMESHNGHSAPWRQTRQAFGQAITQRPQLIVDYDAQGLKGSGHRVQALAAPRVRHGMSDDCHELTRRLKRLPTPGLDNATRDAARPALLAVGKNQVSQGCFSPLIDNLPGRQLAGGWGLLKGHEERLVPLETKTSAGVFELVGTEPEVKENFRHLRQTHLVEDTVQMSKIGLEKRPLARACLESLCGLPEGCGVFVQTKEPARRPQPLAQDGTVPAAAHRAIQDHIVWSNGQPFHHLVE